MSILILFRIKTVSNLFVYLNYKVVFDSAKFGVKVPQMLSFISLSFGLRAPFYGNKPCCLLKPLIESPKLSYLKP